jgi:hypothetical protein
LRVGLVAEGPTDRAVVEAALRAMLEERPFVLRQIYPDTSAAFDPELGNGGWGGVYKWCHAAARRGGGKLSSDALLFEALDILILHLDVDVADSDYAKANLTTQAGDLPLPCAKPCPPPADSANALRQVLLSWCGEPSTPGRVVLCVPAQCTETWVVTALFPNDSYVQQGMECHPNAVTRLGQQPLAVRIKKKLADYTKSANAFSLAWPRVAKSLTEAGRFEREFREAVPT